MPAIHGQTSIEIFVHTGGQFDTGYRAYAVSADIIINGMSSLSYKAEGYQSIYLALINYPQAI